MASGIYKKKFDFQSSKMIARLKLVDSLKNMDLSIFKHTENLLFFKNSTTGIVRSVLLNDNSFSLLNELEKSENLGDWVKNSYKHKITHKNLFDFLKNMNTLDIISILPI